MTGDGTFVTLRIILLTFLLLLVPWVRTTNHVVRNSTERFVPSTFHHRCKARADQLLHDKDQCTAHAWVILPKLENQKQTTKRRNEKQGIDEK